MLNNNNNNDKIKYVNSGTGFLSLLTILFIHHKLIGTIAWSWWWVLSPIWIPSVLAILIVAVVVGVGSLVTK
jgi:hypothetical protein